MLVSLVAGMVTLAAYVLYVWLIVPLIEPPVVRRRPNDGLPAPARRTTIDLAPYFPAEAWERGRPKILETAYGMLLFGDYQPHPDGTLELEPVTLLYFPQHDSNSSPVPLIVQAPGGAVLESDRPINLARGELGRPLAGRLRGTVTIRRPRSHPDRQDELLITARNVQLARHRLWTPNEVEFRLGPHRGRGKDLRIYLQEAHSPAPGMAQLAQVVRQVELVHLDHITLRLDAPQPTASQVSAGQQPPAAAPVWLELKAAGPFRFFVPEQHLVLSDQVELVRRFPDGRVDRLHCEAIEVQLKETSAVGELTVPAVRRVQARGKPVQLDFPSEQLRAEAELLVWDSERGQVTVESTQGAQVQYGATAIQAKRIEYRFPPDKSARQIGEFLVDGPGTVRGLAGPQPSQSLLVTWNDSFSIRPYEGQYLLTVSGQVRCQVEHVATFASQQLYVFLRAAASSKGSPTAQFAPDRLVATGQVAVDSPWISSRRPAQELRVWFVPAEALPAEPTAAAGQPAVPAPPRTQPVSLPKTPPPTQPIWFQGDLVEARILEQDGYLLDDITVAGSVEIARGAGPSEQPAFLLRGELLQASRLATPHPRFQVQGRPATAGVNGLLLEGSQVVVDAKLRRLWLAGSGKMLVPAAPLSGVATGVPVVFLWTEGLEFDGQTLQLRGNVSILGQQGAETGEQHQLVVQGQNLRAQLEQPLEFDHAAARPATGSQLRTVWLSGPIRAEHQQLRGEGQKVAFEELTAGAFQWEYRTGDFHAAGPGVLSSLRLVRFTSLGDAATMPTGESPEKLVHIRVQFQEAIAGNVQQQQVEFRGDVQAAYVPVPDWDSRYEPGRGRLGPDGLELMTDRLWIAQMPSGGRMAPHLEFLATGNVRARGESFTAGGERLSYDDAKDLMVLEGTARSPAVIQTTWGSGNAQARVIRVWPRSRRLQSEGIRGIDFGPITTGSTRP